MLKFLAIQNIVLIDKAEINFSSGLCALSGETGSGKSILLDALGLAIGFRSNLRLIGDDENKSSVIAEFDIVNNKNCQKILIENDLIDSQNSNTLIIRRVISENSSSKAYINDNLVGINILSKIGETLIEIHGQHDQRGLLNSGAHIEILDEFSQNQELLKELKNNYEKLKEIEKKIDEIELKKEQALREKDYLEYIINELEEARVKEDEENKLTTKKDQLIAKEKIINFLNDLRKNLLEANSQLISSQKILIRNQNLVNNFLSEEKDGFEKLNEKIDLQNSDLDNSLSNINKIIRNISDSENNLNEIEERLFYIRSLARKFNVKIEELPKIVSDAKEKLKLLSNEKELASNLNNQRINIITSYQKIADELNNKRKKFAISLARKVEEELKFLKMENVKFLIEVNKNSDDHLIAPNGYNKVRFTAAINNNNFDDIAKIASGGELSRFMLALKVALMDVKSVPTIIFDEIDTGIGGSTADAVGKRLKILAKNLQILVVTHQPQIAAKADLHFKISKISNNQKIKTIIESLDEKHRESEIARMLSGETISKEALAAAVKLINES